MKSTMSNNEKEMRGRFDFSKATRGRFAARYQTGHTVILLDHDRDKGETIRLAGPVETTRQAGIRIFESQVRKAGLRLIEPSRRNGIDFFISSESQADDGGVLLPVKLRASIHEVFSLYKKESRIPRLLMAYIWHANEARESEVYALTYKEALEIVKSKPYVTSKSWIDEGGYSVTHAGGELKEKLKGYRMTPEKWRQRLQSL